MLRKNLYTFFMLVLLCIITSISVFAGPIIPVPTQPQPLVITPSPPVLNAEGYILMDANSGKILVEKNPDTHMAPASLTKLMTMFVISSALKAGTIHLDDKVVISKKAWQTSGSRMFIKVNTEVPVRDLLRGIIIASGNDASVAMAEFLGGTEDAFASIMNAEAKALGMNNSHFVDSNGLPNPDHYSTPRDLAILAQAIIKNFPEDYRLFAEKVFVYNNVRQPNRNRLLWRFPYADGLKTGHTDDAGYCLVASGVKDGMRLISVIMGSPSDEARTEDSMRLLTYGFRFFETHKIYSAGAPVTKARVWKGSKKEVDMGLIEDLYVTFPNGQFKNAQSEIQLNNPIQAPVTKFQPYGMVNITLNGQVLATKPLVAFADDPKGGMWRSFADSLGYTFNKIFSKPPAEKVNNG